MIELLHMDCMDYMKDCKDNQFDLAIVDPPYGIDAGNNILSGSAFVTDKRNGRIKRNLIKRNTYKKKDWDKSTPTKEYFEQLFRVSKNQIIFGGNHFSEFLQSSTAWIVWDKMNVGTYQSDCELAWTSYKITIRKFSFMWSGGFQGSTSDGSRMEGNKKLNEKRIHPTQKPIQLYRWLLQNYTKEGDKILDTHLGSGSIAIACHIEGFDLVGMEIDKDYYDAAVKRFNIHKSQKTLF